MLGSGPKSCDWSWVCGRCGRGCGCWCARAHTCICISASVQQCMPAGVIDISKYAMADRSQRAGTSDCGLRFTYEYTRGLATRLDRLENSSRHFPAATKTRRVTTTNYFPTLSFFVYQIFNVENFACQKITLYFKEVFVLRGKKLIKVRFRVWKQVCGVV